VPAVLGTVFTIVLLRSRPAAIPLWSVWLAILLQLVVWVSTVTIQIPIQLQLAVQGASPELLERLMETNWWLRRVPYSVCAVLFLWMANRAITPHERDA
jgi:mannose/fructose/N-acetylgalactosamine-specific phosphotransferase system component IIC